MIYLKQSTAVNIKIGPFLDDTDGKTAETGLSLTQADVRLSKNGGANAQKNSATAPTHNELGYYTVALSATDTNTLGSLKVMVSKEGALPVWAEYSVLHAKAYDAMFSTGLVELVAAYDNAKTAATQASVNAIPTTPLLAANYTAPDNAGITAIKGKTDNLPASPAAVGSLMNLADGAITDAKIASNAISAAKIASNAIAGAKIATDAVTKIQTGLSTADNLAIVDGLIDTLIARLTETRAGNLDKLAIGAGNTLAHTGNANTFKADVSALAKTTDLNGLATETNATANKNEIKTAIADKPVTPATNIDNLPTKTDIETAKDAIISAMPDIDISTIPDDILDTPIVGTLTVGQVLKVLAAIELGTVTGGGGTSFAYTGKDGTKITLSGVDENGNRGAVNVEFE